MNRLSAAECAMLAVGLSVGCQDVAVERDDVADANNRPTTVTANKVVEETEEALEYAADYAAQRKDEYIRKLDAQMAEYDDEIAAMKHRAAELQGEARAEWNEEIEELQIERAELDQRLETLKTSTGESWQDLKSTTTQMWNDFRGHVKGAAARLERWEGIDVDVDVERENSAERSTPADKE